MEIRKIITTMTLFIKPDNVNLKTLITYTKMQRYAVSASRFTLFCKMSINMQLENTRSMNLKKVKILIT